MSFFSHIKKALIFHYEAHLQYSFQRSLSFKRYRLRNLYPTIIANNCVGGKVYNDLSLRFNSPTINLFFSHTDFIEFLKNLDEYLSIEPIEYKTAEYQYPLGILKKDDKEIVIHFMHYDTFETAKKKWIEHSKRVDLKKLYVIFDYAAHPDNKDEILNEFLSLDFNNQAILTDASNLTLNNKSIVHISGYEHDIFPGKIFSFKPSKFRLRRYFDEFKYVRFLNKNRK